MFSKFSINQRMIILVALAGSVAGLIALMESEFDGMVPVNLGNPEEFTVAELLNKVLALVPTRGRVVNLPLPQDDPRRRKPDIDRAQALLGWQPTVPLDEGLAATVASRSVKRMPARYAPDSPLADSSNRAHMTRARAATGPVEVENVTRIT